MGQITDIEIFISNSGRMARSVRVVKDMIKLYYLDNITVLDRIDRVYDTFIRERERIRAYPDSKLLSEYPDCCLKRVSSYANTIYISRCSDLQRYLSPVGSTYAGFFYDVCIALAREIPDINFSANSRFVMTVTDHVEETWAYYNTEDLAFEQTSRYMYGDDDFHRSAARWKLLPRCIAVNKDQDTGKIDHDKE